MDPDHNGLKVHRPQARLSGTDYDAFWEFVEDEGGVSLGRERDYDWMHFQFARLSINCNKGDIPVYPHCRVGSGLKKGGVTCDT